MQKTGICALLCLIAASTLTAGTVTVQTTASYNYLPLTGSSAWSFGYLSGDPSLLLQSLTIDLGPTGGLAFDTAAGGFGSQGSQAIGNYGGSDVTTGLSGYTPAATDGSTTVTFHFTDFQPGETFQFQADVDHPNPVLTNCAGKTGLALLGCNLGNTTALTTAQVVTANQMANAAVTFTFGGPGFDTGSGTVTFGAVTLQTILQNGLGNHLNNTFVPTPEPASFSMMGGGLLLAGVALLRRKRTR